MLWRLWEKKISGLNKSFLSQTDRTADIYSADLCTDMIPDVSNSVQISSR